MAFRAAGYWRSAANGLRGSSNFTTSTSPKWKPYAAPVIDELLQNPTVKARMSKGDFIPVCFAVGGIAFSTSLGLYTAVHQLGSAPNVFVKKSKREMIPEVVEPEHVAEEARKFVSRSLFRKVGHIKDKKSHEIVPNPILGDTTKRPVRIETLKDIGVEPKL